MSIPNTITTAVYIGSSTDLLPAFIYPEFDWVYITSDGTGYWSETPSSALETIDGFVHELDQRVPHGTRVSYQGNVITCNRFDGSRIVKIFYATKFPELSEACIAAIADARVCWLSGWGPNASQRDTLRKLCPRLETCVVDGSTFQARISGLRLVEVPEYVAGDFGGIEVCRGYSKNTYPVFAKRAQDVGWPIVWPSERSTIVSHLYSK